MIRPENLIEVRYEEFKKDQLAGLREIYEHLGLDGFNEALPVFQEYLKEMSSFQQHSYEISRQTIDLLNSQAGDILEELGYPKRA